MMMMMMILVVVVAAATAAALMMFMVPMNVYVPNGACYVLRIVFFMLNCCANQLYMFLATGRFVGPLVGPSAAPGVQQGVTQFQTTNLSNYRSRLKCRNPLVKYFSDMHNMICIYLYLHMHN